MKLWLDVDDLFFFARHSARPTGIQRLTGEAYTALVKLAPQNVGFVVHADCAGGFCAVDWSEVEAVYRSMTTGQGSRLTAGHTAPNTSGEAGCHRSVFSRFWDWLLQLFSTEKSHPVMGERTILEQKAADHIDLGLLVGPGDVLCSLGAPWHDASYADRVLRATRLSGVRFIMMVHDLIPLVRPEYFEIGRAPEFEKVMRETLPIADVILTNSQATARDVSKWTAEKLIQLKCTPQHIPIGTGFARPPPSALPQGLEAGGFVLFVSTIEVRKNHLQAFRVWAKMLEDLPREQVPTLVFAGSIGWMTGDLLKAIESTNHLNGKLVVIQGADDATLGALYQACLFTLFLSFYEGWGLPVSDSLAFKKICVASNRTSIPEAGGDFCLYVDPDNTTGAYEAIRRLIENPEELGRLERHLATKLEPVPWSATAQAVVAAAFGNVSKIGLGDPATTEKKT